MEDKILKLLQENFNMLNEKIDNTTRAITTLNEKVDIIKLGYKAIQMYGLCLRVFI